MKRAEEMRLAKVVPLPTPGDAGASGNRLGWVTSVLLLLTHAL